MFTQKEWYSTTYVYKVGYSGIDLNSKAPMKDLFRKRSSGRYPRAYPSGVDAAAYIPHKEYIFLFRGMNKMTKDIYFSLDV